MRYLRELAIVFTVLCIFVTLTGCGKGEESSSKSQTSTTATAPALLDVDIAGLLTSEQIGLALGIPVGEAQLINQGTATRYSSEDAVSYAEISMMKCDRSIYDSTVALYADVVDTLNLGHAAKWSAEAKQLLVYGKGYMISITTEVVDTTDDNLLVSARQIAALVLEKL